MKTIGSEAAGKRKSQLEAGNIFQMPLIDGAATREGSSMLFTSHQKLRSCTSGISLSYLLTGRAQLGVSRELGLECRHPLTRSSAEHG